MLPEGWGCFRGRWKGRASPRIAGKGSRAVMANLLTEQDTFFGTIAFRNKLISREQLGQAVLLVQTTHARIRLGEALVRTGALTPRQVEAILEMQQQQR